MFKLKEDACIKGVISLALQTIFEPILRQSKGYVINLYEIEIKNW